MGRICEACGCGQPDEATRGPLTARTDPFEVYFEDRILRFTPSEAEVMFELVQRGRASRERILMLAKSAAEGNFDGLASVRIKAIRDKLAAAEVPAIIVSRYGWGYELVMR